MAFDENGSGPRRLLPRTLKDLLVGWMTRLTGLMLLVVTGLIWASLLTWSAADPSFSSSNSAQPQNILGTFGATVSDLFLQTLGLSTVLGLVCLAVWSVQLIVSQHVDRFQVRGFYGALALLAIGGGCSALHAGDNWQFLHGYGGLLGDLSFNLVAGLLGQVAGSASGLLTGVLLFVLGTWAFCTAIGLDREHIFLIVSTNKSNSIRPVAKASGSQTSAEEYVYTPEQPGAAPIREHRVEPKFNLANLNPAQARLMEYGRVGDPDAPPADTGQPMAEANAAYRSHFDAAAEPFDHIEPHMPGPADASVEAMAERFAPGGANPHRPKQSSRLQEQLSVVAPPPGSEATQADLPAFLGRAQRKKPTGYQKPSLKELAPTNVPTALSDTRLSELGKQAEKLTSVLGDFRVKGEIKDIRPGPIVTLFEFEPARGTKSSRIIALADDVARSMSAQSARISVIPGRSALGIEIPNAARETVLLRELLESDAYQQCDSRLPLVLGKGIGGEPVVADLARMPHLLVAGTTGSGKSVGVNAMILSLLYRKAPSDCRFLLIDPKMLELSTYNGIPHLLAPVITDPHQAVLGLHWAVGEMEQRYKRMTELGVRSIDAFNNRVRHAKRTGESHVQRIHVGFDAMTGEARFEDKVLDVSPMAHIVIIVDEFADLMCVAGKEIEGAVQRLAQMARAAGIHMIMATQRPSVDVVTGTIKANFPTRIGFKVASKIDSRTILNEQGAEQLLGQGDMLLASGGGPMIRAHGPFVSDEEVEAVAKALKETMPPNYDADLCALLNGEIDTPASGGRPSQADIYQEAVAVIQQEGRASTSFLQRRLAIGYNRAAGLIERMEAEGLISAADRSGKRKIVA